MWKFEQFSPLFNKFFLAYLAFLHIAHYYFTYFLHFRIDGRGKSVCAEVIISKDIVKNVLKTDVDTMVRVGQSKLQSGARCAVSIGGSNAHAANIVAATFLATGQVCQKELYFVIIITFILSLKFFLRRGQTCCVGFVKNIRNITVFQISLWIFLVCY